MLDTMTDSGLQLQLDFGDDFSPKEVPGSEYVVDDVAYDIADNYCNIEENRLIIFPIIVPCVIIVSLCMSFVIKFFSKTTMELIDKIRYKKA